MVSKINQMVIVNASEPGMGNLLHPLHKLQVRAAKPEAEGRFGARLLRHPGSDKHIANGVYTGECGIKACHIAAGMMPGLRPAFAAAARKHQKDDKEKGRNEPSDE